MATKVIIFLGPPGSGKGTQADALVARFGFFTHFDTGHVIEKALSDPKHHDDPEIRMEYERFKKGLLNTPAWTMRIMKEGVDRIADSGQGIIFSGSPRTREEAEFLVPFLQQRYGQKSIIVLHLVVKEETSLFRNTHRRICKQCATPLLWSEENEQLAFCPLCGGELVTRVLDNEEAIRLRLKEYEHVTEHILPFFVALGVPIYEIDGEKSPDEVAKEIIEVVAPHI